MPLASAATLKHLAAKVSVIPPPSTLAESAAVLRKLQSFGRVTAFAKCAGRGDREEVQDFDVLFSSPEQVAHACRDSPFAVAVNHDLPNPADIDPYDVRGLQQRKQPRPASMTCEVAAVGREWEKEGFARRGLLDAPSSQKDKGRLYEVLLEAAAPQGLAAGLSGYDPHSNTRRSPATTSAPPATHSGPVSDGPEQTRSKVLQRSSSLMARYRSALSLAQQPLELDDLSSTQSKPEVDAVPRMTRKEKNALRYKTFREKKRAEKEAMKMEEPGNGKAAHD